MNRSVVREKENRDTDYVLLFVGTFAELSRAGGAILARVSCDHQRRKKRISERSESAFRICARPERSFAVNRLDEAERSISR